MAHLFPTAVSVYPNFFIARVPPLRLQRFRLLDQSLGCKKCVEIQAVCGRRCELVPMPLRRRRRWNPPAFSADVI